MTPLTLSDQVLLSMLAVMIFWLVHLGGKFRAQAARKIELEELAASLEKSALEFGPFKDVQEAMEMRFGEGTVILLRSGSRYEVRRSGWRKLKPIDQEEAMEMYRKRKADLISQKTGISIDTGL